MNRITVDIRNATEFQKEEIEQFKTILESTRQVEIKYFDFLIRKNPKLLFAYDNDILVGIGAVKIPDSTYKIMVFEKAESQENPNDFQYELGWIVSLKENKGIGFQIVKSLLAEVNSDVYSTVRRDNLKMLSILKKCGFKGIDDTDLIKEIQVLIKRN